MCPGVWQYDHLVLCDTEEWCQRWGADHDLDTIITTDYQASHYQLSSSLLTKQDKNKCKNYFWSFSIMRSLVLVSVTQSSANDDSKFSSHDMWDDNDLLMIFSVSRMFLLKTESCLWSDSVSCSTSNWIQHNQIIKIIKSHSHWLHTNIWNLSSAFTSKEKMYENWSFVSSLHLPSKQCWLLISLIIQFIFSLV